MSNKGILIFLSLNKTLPTYYIQYASIFRNAIVAFFLDTPLYQH